MDIVQTKPRASRVRGCRALLKRVRALRIALERARTVRATTDVEQTWCARTATALDSVIEEGDLNLPGGEDPRERRRVRKRPVLPMF